MSIPASEHPHDDLAVLALDALAPAEREAVEAHVLSCLACRAELEDYRSTLALVASDDVEPPPAMWASIAQRVTASGNGHVTGPLPTRSHPVTPAPAATPAPGVASLEAGRARRTARGPRRPARTAAFVAAAAAVVVVLGVAVGLRSPDGGTGGTGADVVAAAEAAKDAPGARVAHLSSPEGEVVAEIVVDGDAGYALVDDLAALPDGRAYQLWALTDGEATSLGMLGDGGGDRRAVEVTADDDAPRFAVSEEPEGGSDSPTGAIVATGTFA